MLQVGTETREKISQAMKERWRSNSYRQRMLDAMAAERANGVPRRKKREDGAAVEHGSRPRTVKLEVRTTSSSGKEADSGGGGEDGDASYDDEGNLVDDGRADAESAEGGQSAGEGEDVVMAWGDTIIDFGENEDGGGE